MFYMGICEANLPLYNLKKHTLEWVKSEKKLKLHRCPLKPILNKFMLA